MRFEPTMAASRVRPRARHLDRIRLRPGLLVLVTSAFLCAMAGAQAIAERATLDPLPDIVLVTLGGAGVGDIGIYRSVVFDDKYPCAEQGICTPTLDALGRAGIVFRTYYAGGSADMPSQIAMLSGRHPMQLGVRRPDEGDLRGLPREVSTLPRVLGRRGYRTAHVGQWRAGSPYPDRKPAIDAGFEYSAESLDLGGKPYFDAKFRLHDRRDPKHPAEGELVRTSGYLTRAEFARARAFVDEASRSDAPFFLNLTLHAPRVRHVPPTDDDIAFCSQAETNGRADYRWPAHLRADAIRKLETRFLRHEAVYRSMITYVDCELNLLVHQLEAAASARGRRTLLLVTSDHGADVGAQQPGHNGPLRGGSGQVFEGGIRAPLIAHWFDDVSRPEEASEVSVSEVVFSGLDLLPTLSALAEGELQDAGQLDGIDRNAVLLEPAEAQGSSEREQPIHWEIASESDQLWAVLDFESAEGTPRRWKLVHDALHCDPVCLFELVSDPGESLDLSIRYSERVEQLRESHLEWRTEVSRIDTKLPALPARPSDAYDGVDFDFRAEPTPGGFRLPQDIRYDFNSGDFSFQTGVELVDELAMPQTIAHRPGSWRLLLDRDDQGQVLASLELWGRARTLAEAKRCAYSEPEPHDTGGFSRCRLVITNRRAMHPGWHDIAFTVEGAAYGSNATLRLFVDGQTCLTSDCETCPCPRANRELKSVYSGLCRGGPAQLKGAPCNTSEQCGGGATCGFGEGNEVRLGNTRSASGSRFDAPHPSSFRGVIRNPRFHMTALVGASGTGTGSLTQFGGLNELDADGDGMLNGIDDCPACPLPASADGPLAP